MPAGFKYNLTTTPVIEEICRFETVFRHSGGFNLEDDKLPEGSFLPVGAPIAVDFATRKAKACKNVKLYSAVAAADTEIKIKKGSLAYVGMILGTGSKGATVSNIDKTNADFDTVTVAAAFGDPITIGTVLFEASAAGGTTVKNKANKLNYARVKVEPGATITAIGRAYEIIEDKLQSPISAKDKDTLGDNFMYQ